MTHADINPPSVEEPSTRETRFRDPDHLPQTGDDHQRRTRDVTRPEETFDGTTRARPHEDLADLPDWAQDDPSGVRELMGITLRSFLSLHIRAAGRPVKVKELVEAIDGQEFAVAGRTSKVVSDALRWEIRNGRIRRLARGVYEFVRVPRTTLRRMRERVTRLANSRRAPLRQQPLRDPRPLVRVEGPWRYRLRFALAPPRTPWGYPIVFRPPLSGEQGELQRILWARRLEYFADMPGWRLRERNYKL